MIGLQKNYLWAKKQYLILKNLYYRKHFRKNLRFTLRTPDREISATEAIKWIAKLGGYIGRNNDPPPGIISVWRGWTRLMNMVDDYKILMNPDEKYKTYG